ncbi:MAG: hypothetical protein A3I24_03950 [Candidatus Harrisonbacteria bacterium RIFCSPLOWO2_02_FULL_41_13b]|uniref:Ribulose-phosphate 3-epimerase n=1 Tax=Candidatus Harrisonbacteria bacterium RIFCSPLOWO2_02_FULL_41_13b TaxID=1798409 RepID=A0A1G1ZRR2_9BACT|nr:MAG: hypothetical protein A3J53_00160 [Candidatus Harrisonbacteria bacterium RIFCSPHIGHO2_02_FULL_40_20]OGY66816.1 MAG: hypothetical protein A3I24_03950 [Candidatus Harrisonbacteria bacterium RIFCSPLOWO2_02_FULL_41_13b]
MQIIPAINTKNFKEAKKQIEIASQVVPAGGVIHIDVTDGKFTSNITWGDPQELQELLTSYKLLIANFEIHLMVNNPEEVIEDWAKTRLFGRIIVHLESMKDSEYILSRCRKYGSEPVLAINPTTDVKKLEPYLDKFPAFQILAVTPGLAGQKFNVEVIHKIKFLKKAAPGVKIEVDGGINLETAKLCKEAGADIVVSASYILNSDNPKEAYAKLSGI